MTSWQIWETVWRGGGKDTEVAEGFSLMDVQFLATSEEAEGKQTATTASLPPPPICAGVIKNIWLPIMAPVSSREVEQSCEGCVHNSAQLRAAMNTQPALASTYQSTATACCKYIRASLQEGRRLVKECLWRRRV